MSHPRSLSLLAFTAFIALSLTLLVGCGRNEYTSGFPDETSSEGGETAQSNGVSGGGSGGSFSNVTSGGGGVTGGGGGMTSGGVTGSTGGATGGGNTTGGVTGGGNTTGGGGMTGGGGRETCRDACEYLNGCFDQMCEFEIWGVEECLQSCDGLPIDQILNSTCDELNFSVCQDNPDIAQVCDCGDIGGGGDGTCGEMLDCFQTCRPRDDECNTECFERTSPEGQEQYFAIIECAEEECPNFDGQCIQERCLEELEECYFGEGGGGGGNTFCLQECDPFDPDAMTCQDDTFCFDLGDLGLCAAGSPDEPDVPDDAPRCDGNGEGCPDGFICVQGG